MRHGDEVRLLALLPRLRVEFHLLVDFFRHLVAHLAAISIQVSISNFNNGSTLCESGKGMVRVFGEIGAK